MLFSENPEWTISRIPHRLWVRALHRSVILLLTLSMSSCYFFRKTPLDSSGGAALEGGENAGVLGLSLGQTAGSEIPSDLAAVHALPGAHPPAAIRPDPDVHVRRLIRQYRSEGVQLAREVGRVGRYAELLGGANDDFTTVPQESYDATSLLASYKVAEEVCRGLVAPTSWEHGDWTTILPYAPAQATENIRFLAQRFLGLRSTQVTDDTVEQLQAILDASLAAQAAASNSTTTFELNWASYIPVCATLAIDAEGLLL